ncbi:MAG: hypothetical protein EBV03_04470 [Proteobacteria bacterium]|nr:hypothetical protein [Pseudomonadota bacterium]
MVEIFHESAHLPPLTEDTPLDAHVLAVLLHVMRVGLPLKVHGVLTRQMMRNLEELQLVWCRWKPALYSKVEIMPERVADARRILPQSRAIAAFSGGADATFTALRHNHKKPVLPAAVRHNLTDVMMVHGFDVDLAKPRYMDELIARSRPLLDDLGLTLRVVRTNSKDWQRQSWDDSFALELAACLHLFAGEFDVALVGSSEPYEALVLPWGSSPVNDPLMSSDLMQLVHDSAGYSRTDKIDEIARHPIACQTLKVCWAGEVQSGNCGVCEKCLRTMMNFLAAGHTVPACFPRGLRLGDIPRMKIYNSTQKAELEGILRHARARGTQGAWMQVLEARLKKPLSRYEHPLWRRTASYVVTAMGLKAPLKQSYQHYKRRAA